MTRTPPSDMAESSGERTFTEALDALLELDGWEYIDRPVPDQADDQLRNIVRRFASASLQERRAFRALLCRRHVDLFFGYAVRMAALAVQSQSTEPLADALSAMAFIGDSPATDWKDVIYYLTPIQNAAVRLGSRAHAAFIRAQGLAELRTARSLESPYSRAPWKHRLQRAWRLVVKGPWRLATTPDGGVVYVAQGDSSRAYYPTARRAPWNPARTSRRRRTFPVRVSLFELERHLATKHVVDIRQPSESELWFSHGEHDFLIERQEWEYQLSATDAESQEFQDVTAWCEELLGGADQSRFARAWAASQVVNLTVLTGTAATLHANDQPASVTIPGAIVAFWAAWWTGRTIARRWLRLRID